MTDGRATSRIDTSVPHPARRYNYWLGGKDNFAADRASGDQIAAMMPSIRLAVKENRRFQTRAVRFLAGAAGVRQFLDIGTGIPGPDNVHDVAQAIAPHCRVVYVDNDPIVLAHSRALLNSTPEGATAYVEADVREPARILSDPATRSALDFSQPIGLLMIAVLHFLSEEEVYESVSTLVDALPSGSYMAISHATQDFMSEEERQAVREETATGRHGMSYLRTLDQFGRFYQGLEMIAPGITPIATWRADDEEQPRPAAKDVPGYGAIGRKP